MRSSVKNLIHNLYDEIIKESINVYDINKISEQSLNYIIHTENWNTNQKVKATYINISHPTGGYFDEYTYMLKNMKQKNITFHNRIIYKTIKDVLTNIISNSSNKNLINILKNKKNGQLVTFKFIDTAQQLNITGEMGYNAKFVMDFVLSSIFDSLKRNKTPLLIGFYYTILKTELKRIKFYDSIIEKVIKYKKKIVDDTSKENNITVYYIF